MAVANLPILGGAIPTGACYPDVLLNHLTTTNTGSQPVIVIPDPAGSGDHGVEGFFHIPQNYSAGTAPVLQIYGFLSGAVGATNVPFGYQFAAMADNETGEVVYNSATEHLASFTSSDYTDEDLFLETIALTGADYAVGDMVKYFVYWDDSVASPYGGNVLLAGLYFQYTIA